MKKILYLIFLFFAPFLFIGCNRNQDEPEAPARRTILVYMAAKNSLAGFDASDIGEMLRANISSGCRLLVFRSPRGAAPQLYEISKGELKSLKIYDDTVIGADSETLIQVLADARSMVNSRQWGVVFWSHSTGWKGAVKAPAASRTFGFETGGYEIELTDLADALRSVPPLEFLFFDSCYMGGVEVAYELRDCARYFVASPCEVPMSGMPYDLTLPSLFDSNTREGLKRAVDINVDYYLDSPNERCPSTMALIDLSKMDNLARASKGAYARSHAPLDTPQQLSLTAAYKNLFVDFEDFVLLTADEADDLAGVRRALSEAVVHERHTSLLWGDVPLLNMCGLSVNPQPFNPDYNYQNLSWFKDVILPYGFED